MNMVGSTRRTAAGRDLAPRGPARPGPATGALLIEVLVALAALLAGGLALWRLQAALPQEVAQARQGADVARRLQAQAEAAQAWLSLSPRPDLPAGTDWGARGARPPAPWRADALTGPLPPPPPGTRPEGEDASPTAATEVLEASPRARALRHRMDWTDAQGRTRRAWLDHWLAAIDPVAAALSPAFDRPGLGFAAPALRAAGLPADARDLEDGGLVWRPLPGHAPVWRLDPLSGEVTARCQADPALPDDALRASDLQACERVRGLPLSGRVRFATRALTPGAGEARDPRDPVAALDVCLHEGDGLCLGAPRVQCFDDAPAAGAPATGPAPAGPGAGASVDAPPDGPAVRYACLILGQGEPPRWSGRLDLAPAGWALGPRPGQFRVCRYSADHDGDGRTGPSEHPAAWRDVGMPLSGQNFLVVRGEAACPAAPASADNPGDAGTVPHQPDP